MAKRTLTTHEKYQLVGISAVVSMFFTGFMPLIGLMAYLACIYLEFKAKTIDQKGFLPPQQSVGTLNLLQCGIGTGLALGIAAIAGMPLMILLLVLYLPLAYHYANKYEIYLEYGK